MRWSQPLSQGPPPIPRFGHTMTLCGSKAIVYGGSSGAIHLSLNDHLAVLDLETMTWSSIVPAGVPPKPIHYHSGVVHGSKIYFYGGVKKCPGIFVLDMNSIDMLRIRNFQEAREFVQKKIDDSCLRVDVLLQREAQIEDMPVMNETVNFVRQNITLALAEMKKQLHVLIDEEAQFSVRTKNQWAKLEEAQALFEDQKTKMTVISHQQQSKVRLNIGGQRYETSMATLVKDGETMLAAMFSGLYCLPQDPVDNSFFIDRDGTHFRYILNYLRDGSFNAPTEPHLLRELLQEAEFYQIKGLIKLLRELTNSDED